MATAITPELDFSSELDMRPELFTIPAERTGNRSLACLRACREDHAEKMAPSKDHAFQSNLLTLMCAAIGAREPAALAAIVIVRYKTPHSGYGDAR